MEFEDLARRWIGLIKKAASEYQIPGRLDFDDCVQEALLALHDVHQRALGTPFDPDVNPEVFEKWVKTAIFHRLVDVKRKEKSALRDWTKDLSPLPVQDSEGEFVDFFASIASREDSPDQTMIADQLIESISDRLSTCNSCVGLCKCGKDHRLVLQLLTNPSEDLLKFCSDNGSPSKVKQVLLEKYLGWTKQQIGDAVWQIRHRIKDFRPAAPLRLLSQLFYFLGFTDGEESGFRIGFKVGVSITYEMLLSAMAEDERKIMSFLATPGLDTGMTLTDLSVYLGMSTSQVRDALARMRVRVDLAVSGAPMDSVANCFRSAA